jgi:hypothetical protein
MPGYLVDPISNASGVSILPYPGISSTNVQDAIEELQDTSDQLNSEKLSIADLPPQSKAPNVFLGGM